jgi:hypothetical protein
MNRAFRFEGLEVDVGGTRSAVAAQTIAGAPRREDLAAAETAAFGARRIVDGPAEDLLRRAAALALRAICRRGGLRVAQGTYRFRAVADGEDIRQIGCRVPTKVA